MSLAFVICLTLTLLLPLNITLPLHLPFLSDTLLLHTGYPLLLNPGSIDPLLLINVSPLKTLLLGCLLLSLLVMSFSLSLPFAVSVVSRSFS